MDRKKIEIIITAILVIVFGLLLARSLNLFRKAQKFKNPVSKVPVHAAPIVPKSVPVQEVQREIKKPVVNGRSEESPLARPDVTSGRASTAEVVSPGTPGSLAAVYPNIAEDEKLEWERCPYSGKLYTETLIPIITTGPVMPKLELGGIIWDAVNPKALINNEVVQPGDTVGSCTVKEIEQDCVILNDGTKDLELTL